MEKQRKERLNTLFLQNPSQELTCKRIKNHKIKKFEPRFETPKQAKNTPVLGGGKKGVKIRPNHDKNTFLNVKYVAFQ